MADFDPIFKKMIVDEGGYVLHEVKGDTGGLTYAGIAQNYHPTWQGWRLIKNGDRGSLELSRLVREFYVKEFWDAVRGDDLGQDIANVIFNFAVNASPRVAVKLAQSCVDCVPDGVLGPRSIAALNAVDFGEFNVNYALAKIARYAAICNKSRTQSKFLLGWVNRTLGTL